ncbi:MAG TPA: deoxyribonuclease IV [Acidimicrobiales bacterium]|nr:deoxyribonuclease IV [Acidimicrobiales bacterium]
MLFGAQVRSAGGLPTALARGEAMGAEVVQVFTQSPRTWRPTPHDPAELAAYPERQRAGPVVVTTYCHATYLINLATTDPPLYERSWACLVANLEVAAAIGARGLVLHLGSHRGAGLGTVVAHLAEGLLRAVEEVGDACPVLLENTAGAGGTVGATFEELGTVLDRLGWDPRFGVCLDTQHLWAAGVPYASLEEADATVAALDRAIGLDRLSCLHVNDSKVPLGSRRDRHENLGAGTIGADALASLLGHPRLQGLPAILEVPGCRDRGPGADDLHGARAIHRVGVARWASG